MASRARPGSHRNAIEVAVDTGSTGWRSLPTLDPAGDLPEIAVAADGTVTLAWRELEHPEAEGSPNWIEAATYSP